MKTFENAAKVNIRVLGTGWKIADETDDTKYVKELLVKLAIMGNRKDGFHLVMEPEGCFAADYHYFSLSEAKKDALKLFGVAENSWDIKEK